MLPIIQLFLNQVNIATTSDVILVGFGVIFGITISNLDNRSLSNYAIKMMKKNKSNHYFIYFISALLISVVFGITSCMAITTYLKLTNFWIKFVIGIITGTLTIGFIKTLLDPKLAGAYLSEWFIDKVKSIFGTDSDKIEVKTKRKRVRKKDNDHITHSRIPTTSTVIVDEDEDI